MLARLDAVLDYGVLVKQVERQQLILLGSELDKSAGQTVLREEKENPELCNAQYLDPYQLPSTQ